MAENIVPSVLPSETTVLLFDLGGVLYNIDFRKLEHAFDALQHQAGVPSGSMRYDKHHQPDVITLFETGVASKSEFFRQMRLFLSLPNATEQEITSAWCAMLLGMFPERDTMLAKLATRYTLYLLSNINPLHYEHIMAECAPMFRHFQRLYLSYEIGMRKPNSDIYDYVVNDIHVPREQILFFDDAPANIETAEQLGIPSVYVHDAQALDIILTGLV
jgi:putative hydrolase of the HAD superfamily